MAKGASGTKVKTANPMLTRNGKTRLGPMNVAQLEAMLEKSSRPKDKAKILNRVTILKKKLHVGKYKVVETFK
jgi:hypothetical protein